MKGIGKRLCALTLGILMVCLQMVTVFATPADNCPGGCTHLAAIGTTHYDTLEEAVAAAQESSTVTLLADVALTGTLAIDRAVVLDLGGKTLSGQTEETGTLLLVSKDFTLKNGTLSTDKGTCLTLADCQLTLEKTANISTEGAVAIYLTGSGSLTVEGGTYRAKDHAIVLDIPKDGKWEASVTDGEFITEKETFRITAAENAVAPSGFVTGGSFRQDPTAYIADHCGVTVKDDNTFAVVTAYTLTFQANGGSGKMQTLSVPCGKSVKLPECGFTAPKGKDFAGWKIGKKTYAPGDTYTPSEHVTVTAQWKAHIHSGGKATCQNKAVCKACGASYGKLASHKFKQISAFDPTCSASGVKSHQKCLTCGQRFVNGKAVSSASVTVPALGHNWETVEGTPATCTEAGIKAHQKCSQCGALRMDGEAVKEAALAIPAGEHVLETVAAANATCKEPGTLAHERCTACGLLFVNGRETDADSLSIPTVSHVLSDWYSDDTEHWKACVDCGETFRQKKHTDSDLDGVCDDCGHTVTAPAEQIPAQQEETGSRPFLIPVIVTIAIAVGGTVLVATKKRKQ